MVSPGSLVFLFGLFGLKTVESKVNCPKIDNIPPYRDGCLPWFKKGTICWKWRQVAYNTLFKQIFSPHGTLDITKLDLSALGAGAKKVYPDSKLNGEDLVRFMETVYANVPVYKNIINIDNVCKTREQIEACQRAKNFMIRLATICFEPDRQ